MVDYPDISKDIENDHEAQLLNEFYNQKEEVHWRPVAKSEKQQNLERIRDTYYLNKAILQKKMEGKLNANHK